jgi:hypothetical protein
VQSLPGLSHTKLEDTKEEHLELALRALDRLAPTTIEHIAALTACAINAILDSAMADDDLEPDAEPEPFTIPVPPPPLPFAREEDVVFFARGREPKSRDHEDIMLRRVPRDVANRFRGAAGARGLTHAQYLAALVALHEAMRQRADGRDVDLAAELARLGLSTVSI